MAVANGTEFEDGAKIEMIAKLGQALSIGHLALVFDKVWLSDETGVIEGSELELFSENTNWIDQSDLLYVELHDWMLPGEQSSKTFLSKISSLNRDFLLSGENVVSIKNLN